MFGKGLMTRLIKFMYIFAIMFLLTGMLLSAVSFPALAQEEKPEAPGAAGAIWTTNETCDNPAAQDDNLYAVGETVHIRGSNFDPDTDLTWAIAGQPGSATPGLIASGTGRTDAAGYFCVTAHTIQPGEGGTYTVDVTVGNAKKNDNYRVEGVEAAPLLTLDKIASPQTYAQAGETISYSYVLTNSGNVPLDSPYSVSDDKAAVTCPQTPDPLEVGGSITCSAVYTITQTDVDAGFVTNLATGYANYGGNQVGSNQDSETVTAIQNTGLSLDKTVNPLTYSMVGNLLSYSYMVTNTGNVTVTGLNVDDDKVSVTCPATTLAPGASMTCTASHTINQADLDLGYVTNNAIANGQDPNGAPVVSNPDTATATAEQTALLTLDKSAAPATYDQEGDVISYSYLLTNSGNVALTGFTVTDDRTAVDCSGAATTLLPGQSTTCTASYIITQADMDLGYVTNTAQGHGFWGAVPVDSNPDSATVDAVAAPGLSLVKSVQEAFYSQVGDVLHYAFLLTNTGNVTLDAPFTVLDDMTDNESCPAVTSLAPGEQITCTASYLVSQVDVDAGSVTNIAYATGRYNGGTVTSNEDTVTVQAQAPGAALRLEKSVTPGTYAVAGDTLSYSYLLTNIGGVTLYAPYSVDDDKTSVTCPTEPASLAPGESVTCTASYTITQADVDAGQVTNTASGHAFDGAGVPVDSNVDTATATAVQTPALTLVKSVTPGTYSAVDQVLSYTYQITNSGNVTLTGFTVTDDIIDPLGGVDCTGAATTLLPGESTSCTASYTITQADIDAGEVTNVATAHGFWGAVEVNSNDDTETALVEVQGPSLVLEKTALPLTYSVAGDIISYSYKLTNNGNVTLEAPFTVDDDKTIVTCPDTPTSLAPGESITCSAAYTITPADMLAGEVTNIAQGHAVFEAQAVDSNQDSATVTAQPLSPVVTVTAVDGTTCAALPGEECLTFTVTISGLTIGTVNVFADAPDYLDVEEPLVLTEDGEYQITICGDWPGIPNPEAGVEIELSGYAEWYIEEELQEQVGAGSGFVRYDPQMQFICFPLDSLLFVAPFCYKVDGEWTMAVQVENPNDESVEFGWSLNGGGLQAGTAAANDVAWLANLPLGVTHTIAIQWGVEGFAEQRARLNLSDCQPSTPTPPPPPPPSGTPVPVTAVEQPGPVVESAELIPVTGIEWGGAADLGFLKGMMIYLGLGFLGAAIILQSLHKRSG